MIIIVIIASCTMSLQGVPAEGASARRADAGGGGRHEGNHRVV